MYLSIHNTFLRTYRLDFFYESVCRKKYVSNIWQFNLNFACFFSIRFLIPRKFHVLLIFLNHLFIQSHLSPWVVAWFLQLTSHTKIVCFWSRNRSNIHSDWFLIQIFDGPKNKNVLSELNYLGFQNHNPLLMQAFLSQKSQSEDLRLMKVRLRKFSFSLSIKNLDSPKIKKCLLSWFVNIFKPLLCMPTVQFMQEKNQAESPYW